MRATAVRPPLFCNTRGISARGDARGHIAGNHASRTDHRIISNRNARENNGTATNPDVASDGDGTSEFSTSGAQDRVSRMVRRVYLHSRANLRSGTDGNRGNIKNHAIEVEEYSGAEPNVITIVAVKRRPNDHAITNFCQPFQKKSVSVRNRRAKRCVVSYHPRFCRCLIRLEFRIACVIKLARQHFLLFGSFHSRSPLDVELNKSWRLYQLRGANPHLW